MLKGTLLLFISTIFVYYTGISQIIVTNTQTPEQLVQGVLLGNGVVASNIKYNGSLINSGSIQSNVSYFDNNGTSFPINKGVLLTSGNGIIAQGPNDNTIATGVQIPSFVVNDADLSSLTPNSIENGVVLEFDFVATGDTVSFNYMFASEEYPNDFGTTYYDVFGFFLSGAGINGIYSNNGINLALLPGTNTAISIQNLNPTNNSQYYVDNTNGTAYGTAIQYDGTSIILTSGANLICGQTYHIKLCIANSGDQSLDSGVFLQAQSFSSNIVTFSSTSSHPGTFVDTLLSEDCTTTEIQFVRPLSSIDTMNIFHFEVSGSANNLDFAPFADSVIFNIGVDTVSINLIPINDGIIEPMEWIQINAFNVTACGDTIRDSIRIYLVDKYTLTYDIPDTIITNCSNINPSIEVTNIGNSIPPYIFSWSNSTATNPTTFVNTGINHDSTYFYGIVTDGCGEIFLDSVLIINDYEASAFSISPNDTLYNFCPTSILTATVILDSLPHGPYIYDWSTDSTTASSNLINGGINGSEIMYYVTTTNICGISTTNSVVVINNFEGPTTFLSPNDTIYTNCLLDSSLSIVMASGGTMPYSYLWSNGSTNDSTYIHDLLGFNNHSIPFQVTITDACANDTTLNGVLIVQKTLDATLTQDPATCIPDGDAYSTYVGETGTPTFEWIGPGHLYADTTYLQDNLNISSGWYYYTVTDDVCTDSDSIFVELIQGPIAKINADPLKSVAPATITFSNTSQNSTNYFWNFGNGLTETSSDLSSQTSLYNESGIYTIEMIAFNGACSDTAFVTIELIDRPYIVNEPNVFSPNNDGDNDLFFITTLNVEKIELIITNRWGSIVFEETGPNPKWNGSGVNDGVYFYTYKATGYNGEVLDGQGFLHLVNQ